MNESGFSMRIGLAALTVYFSISFGILFLVGDYNEAVSHARAVDAGRLEFATSPKGGCGVDDVYSCYEEWSEPLDVATSTPGVREKTVNAAFSADDAPAILKD
jgi:hypothetical protein